MFVWSQVWSGSWNNNRGKIPGDWNQTILAQRQSRKIRIVVSGVLHLGHQLLSFGWEKARYWWVGNRLRMDFQMKIMIFLGQWISQIQLQRDFANGILDCWYKNFEVELTEQTPLFWGQTKESDNMVNWITGIPWISCSSCFRGGNCRSSNRQIWWSYRELTILYSSFGIRWPSIRLHSGLSGIQWSSYTWIVWPSPNIHFIPWRSHCFPTWMAFQMWDALVFMLLSKRFVWGKYLAFKTWAQSMDG